MLYRVFNNGLKLKLAVSLLTVCVFSVHAGKAVYQPSSQHSLLLTGGNSNPWALSQPPENTTDSQFYPQRRGSQFRFVTPEILESLKQQQIQNQQVTDNYPVYRYRQPQSAQPQSQPQPQFGPVSPVQGYSGYPAGGVGSSNLPYDVPTASPWGNGADMLYQGESFPWLPNAAIGGIPPINTQPFIESDDMRNTEQGYKQNNNVFNPFTFGPNGNL